ncbi:unnamed protein product, partial [marine sediment metagenome]
EAYHDTWKHPHRNEISMILKQFHWISLLEVGCGGGANMVNILKHHKGKQVGGIDVSPDAIAFCESIFDGAFLKVGSVEDIMMSDSSTDIVLSDMTMIYVDKPSKAIKEIKRVARQYVLFCELHTESWYSKMKLKLSSGYNAHNYKKLLKKHGFEDIRLVKFGPETWPGGNPQKDYGYFIFARVP